MYTVYSDKHELHPTDQVRIEGSSSASAEVPARATALLEATRTAGLGSVIAPSDHGLAPILAVHDADFVHFLRTAYQESSAYFGQPGPVSAWTFANRWSARKPKSFLALKGYYAFGWGTPILERTWEAAYWSAQCALTAADLLDGGERASYALCRPPGHHAGPDFYGGFCYLNNAAIAARHLGRRAAILDIDYHHGNGTQVIFYRDPSVLYCSLHAHPDLDYPYYWGDADERGEGPGQGTNRNWPLPLETGDERYLAALDEALATIGTFSPQVLLVSAGFDTAAGDPVGHFRLTAEGLAAAGRRIAALGLQTLIVQEGGYLVERLGQNALSFLQAFARPGKRPG